MLRQNNRIARIDKEITHEPQPMRQGAGDDRHPEDLVLHRRILFELLGAPKLTKLRPARGRRVGIDLARIHREELVEILKMHRNPALCGNPDGGVEPIGLRLGLRSLADNPLGKIQSLPKI